MKKSPTLIDLKHTFESSAVQNQTDPEPEDWKHDPIHAGSIYIKPTKDAECNFCGWFYYILCCGFCYSIR